MGPIPSTWRVLWSLHLLSYSDTRVVEMAESETVSMTCMTTKNKFDVENPTVVVLANGRYAYKVDCPWEGKNGKKLTAFKFCSHDAYLRFVEREAPDAPADTGAVPPHTEEDGRYDA